MCNYASHSCSWMPILFAFTWIFLTSSLTWLTWNRVVADLTRMKPVAYWQALLFVTTIFAFAAPKFALQARGKCHHGMEMHTSYGMDPSLQPRLPNFPMPPAAPPENTMPKTTGK